MRVLIWGAGRNFKIMMNAALWRKDTEVIGVIESVKHTDSIQINETSYVIYEPAECENMVYDKIIVTPSESYVDEIVKEIRKYHIPEERVLIPTVLKENQTKWDLVRELLKYMYNPEAVVSLLLTYKYFGTNPIMPMGYDLTENTVFNQRLKYDFLDGDYARVRTLELLVQEIMQNQRAGAMAEVGVFQGTFAKVMKDLMPEKTLYLYDIFQGFDPDERAQEVEQGNVVDTWCDVFKLTSVEKVKEYIGHDETCEYRVGYFPDSIRNERNEKFCLVSLDADLYNPTLAGLEFFYPRLVTGGYIMIHEYNHRGLDGYAIQAGVKELNYFEGIKQAVEEFEKRHGHICKVPISDRNGTVIITK